MSISVSATDIALESNLNLMAAAPLAQKLTEQFNVPVLINAENVDHIDLPCLQILIAASRQWQSSDVSFEIKDMSEGFTNSLSALGLTPEIFHTPEST